MEIYLRIFIGILSSFLLFGILRGKNHYESLNNYQKKGWFAAVWTFLAICFFRLARVFFVSLLHPKNWDYLGFWLIGQVAVQGGNFYDPEAINLITDPLPVTASFQEEFIDVGSLYSPPSTLLFYPLGFVNFYPGLTIWYSLVLLSLLVFFLLAKKVFLNPPSSKEEALTLSCLIFGFPQVATVLYYGQINFLLLCTLTLFLWQCNQRTASIWVILSAFNKPFALILLFWEFLAKKWSQLILSIILIFGMFLLAFVIYGPEVYRSFFFHSSILKAPEDLWTQQINQSLLAVSLRLFESANQALIFYVLCITALLTVTGWGIYRRPYSRWGIVSLLIAGILITPHSLTHYSVLLIIPTVMLWTCRQQKNGLVYFIPLIYLTLDLGSSALSPNPNMVFFTNLIFWGITTYELYRESPKHYSLSP